MPVFCASVFAIAPWLSQYCEYLDWYWNVACNYATPLEVLLDPPIVCLRIKRTEVTSHRFRYGLLFKLYDRWIKEDVPGIFTPFGHPLYQYDFLWKSPVETFLGEE